VSLRELDTEALESFKELRLVCVEQRAEVHALGISAPSEEEVEQIERAVRKANVENTIPTDGLEVESVSVAKEEEHQIPMLGPNGRSKRGFNSGLLRRLVGACLNRSTVSNPPLSVVHTTGRAEMDQLA
jgi:hypothetical protein